VYGAAGYRGGAYGYGRGVYAGAGYGGIGYPGIGGVGGPGINWGRFTGDYAARYPPGYRTYWSGGAAYYGYPVLPAGVAPINYMGQPGYFGDGVYYLPEFYDGEVVYIAVPPPS
jgi:hypothetical protein